MLWPFQPGLFQCPQKALAVLFKHSPATGLVIRKSLWLTSGTQRREGYEGFQTLQRFSCLGMATQNGSTVTLWPFDWPRFLFVTHHDLMSLFSNLGHAVFVVLTMLLKFQTCLIVAPHPHMWEFKGMLRIFMAPNCKTMTTVLTETWQCDHSLASHLSVTVTITNNFHHGNNSQLAKLLPWQQIIPVAAILTRAKIVRDTAVAVCLIAIIVSQRVALM